MVNKVFVHATYNCDATCVHCAAPKTNDVLPLEDFKKIADASRANNVESIIIGGGEPLLHPNLVEMVKYAAGEGIKVRIETNGKRLDEAILESLKGSLFQMNVSLDGADAETHDRIRGRNAFQNVVASIRRARELGIDVSVCSVVSKDNASEAPAIVTLARSLGVSKLSFLYATPVGAGYKNRDAMLLDPEEYFGLLRRITPADNGMEVRVAPYLIPFNMIPEFRETYTGEYANLGCTIPNRDIIRIDPRGNIFPCVLLLSKEEFSMGNIRDTGELTGVLRGDEEYWGKIIQKVDELMKHSKEEGYPEIGCIGLSSEFGVNIDPRSTEGLPLCPAKTIKKEWR